MVQDQSFTTEGDENSYTHQREFVHMCSFVLRACHWIPQSESYFRSL